MPVFTYEAMDNTGLEVKDTIEASSQEEAQQRIRDKGFFVTKIQEKTRAKKKKAGGPAQKKPAGARKKGQTFSIGGVRSPDLI